MSTERHFDERSHSLVSRMYVRYARKNVPISCPDCRNPFTVQPHSGRVNLKRRFGEAVRRVSNGELLGWLGALWNRYWFVTAGFDIVSYDGGDRLKCRSCGAELSLDELDVRFLPARSRSVGEEIRENVERMREAQASRIREVDAPDRLVLPDTSTAGDGEYVVVLSDSTTRPIPSVVAAFRIDISDGRIRRYPLVRSEQGDLARAVQGDRGGVKWDASVALSEKSKLEESMLDSYPPGVYRFESTGRYGYLARRLGSKVGEFYQGLRERYVLLRDTS